MKRILIATLLAAFVAMNPAVVRAADKPTEKAAEGNKGKRPMGRPTSGTIKSFDKATETLTLEGEKAQTFLVTSTTRIMKDGKSATTDALVAGEKVGLFVRTNAVGKVEAVSIRIGQMPRRGGPADKSKGEEKKAQ